MQEENIARCLNKTNGKRFFQALFFPVWLKWCENKQDTEKRFFWEAKRKIRQKKEKDLLLSFFFYLMAEVKRNVEGNIHLAFHIVYSLLLMLLLLLQLNFTLESFTASSTFLQQWRSVNKFIQRLFAMVFVRRKTFCSINSLSFVCLPFDSISSCFFCVNSQLFHMQGNISPWNFFFRVILNMKRNAEKLDDDTKFTFQIHTNMNSYKQDNFRTDRHLQWGILQGRDETMKTMKAGQRQKEKEKLEWSRRKNFVVIKDSLWWSKWDKMMGRASVQMNEKGKGSCNERRSRRLHSSEQFLLCTTTHGLL